MPVSGIGPGEGPAATDDLATIASPCHNRRVLDFGQFQNLHLRGGFTLVEVRLTARPLVDPLRRQATAQTVIRGTRLYILLRAGLDERELSVSLYHEVLEAATLAAGYPPDTVIEFNEGAFEKAAQAAYARLGLASPQTLNQMLVEFGF